MHVFLDHLASILIMSVLALIFALIQFRGIRSNAEVVVNHSVRSETLEIVEMLERDIMNLRTDVQTQTAITNTTYAGLLPPDCDMTLAGDTTTVFTFPTLADPQSGDTAAVALVSYVLIPEADSVSRMINGAIIKHPLHRLERIIGTTVTGKSQSTVTYFKIDYFRDGGAPVVGTSCPADMNRIRFQVQMAQPQVEDITPDQISRSQTNFSRYGATIDLANWE